MKKTQKTFWRINEQIRTNQLRVIGPDRKQIGILSRDEAIAKARGLGFDLVEIAPHAEPPVVRIIEFAKFKYEQEKKEKEERKREKKGTTLKEIWFRPLIAKGDYEVRLARVREFLEEGAKVRITIKPKRRLDNTKPLYRLLERIIKDVVEVARVEQEPRMMGRQLATLITPIKRQKHHEEQKTENENQKIGATPVQNNGGGEDSTSPKLQGTSSSQ